MWPNITTIYNLPFFTPTWSALLLTSAVSRCRCQCPVLIFCVSSHVPYSHKNYTNNACPRCWEDQCVCIAQPDARWWWRRARKGTHGGLRSFYVSLQDIHPHRPIWVMTANSHSGQRATMERWSDHSFCSSGWLFFRFVVFFISSCLATG